MNLSFCFACVCGFCLPCSACLYLNREGKAVTLRKELPHTSSTKMSQSLSQGPALHCCQFSKGAPDQHQLRLRAARKSLPAELSTLGQLQEPDPERAYGQHVPRVLDFSVLGTFGTTRAFLVPMLTTSFTCQVTKHRFCEKPLPLFGLTVMFTQQALKKIEQKRTQKPTNRQIRKGKKEKAFQLWPEKVT